MSDNTNNGFPVPEEPLTREEEYLSAIAGVTEATEIPEKPLTRVEAYLDKIVENGGGGGGGGTVNNAKITIQINGTDVESFTLNQSTDETINITVPTSAADVSAIPADEKGAASGVAELDSNGQIAAATIAAGALANGMTATTQTTSDDSTKVATTAFVHDVVDLLPSPMVYKGTLGTGGTKTTLPVDGTAEVGDTYKVITAGTYASQAAKVGDMFICLTKATSSNTWSYVPSGDDTDVTQVSAGTGLTTASGSPITTTGTIKAKLKSSTALAEAATNSTTTGKSYAVNVDSAGDLACNVPWTDTTYTFNTAYNASTNKAATMSDITTSAENGTLTGYEKKTGNVAATDKIVEAIGKLETKADTNETNILSEQAKTTSIGNATNAIISPHKNRLNYTLSSLKKINTSGSWADNVYTLNNTTFTVNDDYTITVSSTLTSGNANFFLFSAKSVADLATCIVSGCPAVSGASIHCEMAESPWSTICIDTGNSAVISSTTKKANLYIQISGSVSNIKFEPMICEPVYWSVSHEYAEPNKEVLKGKKILYNGDSICESRLTGFSANGGGYAKLIADETGCFYDNRAVSGGTLAVVEGKHNICTDVTNMPYDGDLICFEGGINDYWNNVPLGTFSETDYTSSITGLDTATVCGALEAIIRQAIARWTGVPICFVIVHKIVGTAYTPNTAGYTFAEMREQMIAILNKYSIPYYDCYAEGGLNGYIWYLNDAYLNGGSTTHPDGCHPDEGGYRRYYVPQLIDLFTRIMPKLK